MPLTLLVKKYWNGTSVRICGDHNARGFIDSICIGDALADVQVAAAVAEAEVVMQSPERIAAGFAATIAKVDEAAELFSPRSVAIVRKPVDLVEHIRQRVATPALAIICKCCGGRGNFTTLPFAMRTCDDCA